MSPSRFRFGAQPNPAPYIWINTHVFAVHPRKLGASPGAIRRPIPVGGTLMPQCTRTGLAAAAMRLAEKLIEHRCAVEQPLAADMKLGMPLHGKNVTRSLPTDRL